MQLLLCMPPTLDAAHRYVAAHPDARLCALPRASHLAAHRALFRRVAALARQADAAGAAPGAGRAEVVECLPPHAALPCAARALWRLSLCALLQPSAAARQPAAAAQGGGERGEALAAAETGPWASEEAAQARLSYLRAGGGRVRHWVRAAAADAARSGDLGSSSSSSSSTRARRRLRLRLVLTLREGVLLCIPPVSHLLVRAERSAQALRDTVAMVSTLGGGYFLVKDIPRAIALARRQAWLAWRLGDDALWRASHLHLIYIAMQVGAWARSGELIDALTPGAAAAGDERFLAMLHAASGYLARTREWAEAGRLAGQDAHRQALAVVQGDVLRELVVLHFGEAEDEEEALALLASAR